jgi:flagellum-specific ATP synthase
MSWMEDSLSALDRAALMEMRGTVVEVRGLAIRVADMPAAIGAGVRVLTSGGQRSSVAGEVVGFDQSLTIVMPLGDLQGVRRGDEVVVEQPIQSVRVGASLLGRVLNARGEPIDGKGPLRDTLLRPLSPPPVDPMTRPHIEAPLATGVRAVDTMLTVGRGQRLGVFASPGLGKSTLLGTMAKHTSAQVTVIGLVGERGRELRDFIDLTLGEEGMARSVVVCATSDEPALLRLRCAWAATAVAEHFRDQGMDVLLILDSVTRFCQAQRQVGLSAGEPPTSRGYTPSVFALLPTLLERCGRTLRGSITGFFSILVEGDELTDPIADAARGILDGHIVLSRRLAERGHWPAIDVRASISRVADQVVDDAHRGARERVVRLLAAYSEVEDLLNIGAYAEGSNPDFDLAIKCKPAIDRLLRQSRGEVKGVADFGQARAQLLALGAGFDAAQASLSRGKRKPA